MVTGNGSEVTIGAPSLPLPIFRLSARRQKYMLYDINIVTWLRQAHHILGVQIGGMPQFPQQNVFFGLPLELMPEEAHLLVETGVAYIVDDLEMHEKMFLGLAQHNEQVMRTAKAYEQENAEAAKKAEEEVAKAKAAESERARAHRMHKSQPQPFWNAARLPEIGLEESRSSDAITDGSLFSSIPGLANRQFKPAESWSITPSTASAFVEVAPPTHKTDVDVVRAKYAMFKHLHDNGYFMSPGLRFGCQLMAYPGDPLRFHSHFLCNGVDWDEEFDLLDIVGGGRLGTGVKKGFLVGGQEEDGLKQGKIRTFCIEWGGL